VFRALSPEDILTRSRGLQEFFDQLSLGIVWQDAAGAVLAANTAATRILGMSLEQLKGRSAVGPEWRSIREDGTECPPDEHSALVALRSGRPVHGFLLGVYRPFASDYRWLRVTSVPVFDGRPEPVGVYSLLEDVTEARAAQQALAARMRQQETVVELQQLAISEVPVQVLLDRACERVCEVLEATTAGILEPATPGFLRIRAGAGWSLEGDGPLIPSEGDRSQAAYTLRVDDVVIVEDFSTETRFHVHEFIASYGVSGISVPIPVGPTSRWVLGIHSRSERHFSDDDVHFVRTVAGLLGAALRETLGAAALRSAHALSTAVIEGSGDAILIKDLAGRYVFANTRAGARLGLTVEELIGKKDHDVFPPQMAALFREQDEQIVATGREAVFESRYGELIPGDYLVTKVPYRDAHGRIVGVIVIARDITERRRLEEQLRETQKLEAIGRLAGGIAHDFNNLLTVILGYADALRAGPPAAKAAEHIDEIRAAAERAALLTGQLLAFSRRQILHPQVLQPNDAIGNMERMLRRIIGEDIHFQTALCAEGHVRVDPGQLEQVVLNLAVNARDAMPAGGRLTIETADVEFDRALLRRHPEAVPGPYVMLAVSDTGTGMDDVTLSRAFEPFFTTKGSRGTGLGLATVYGIVKQSGGEVWAYSEPGTGSSFKVYFPRVTPQVATAGADGDRDEVGQPNGRERVLVVEDEPAVRALVAGSLRRRGYTVAEAADGTEALTLIHGNAEPFHLVVTDVIMPRMGGRELADVLAAEQPGLPVLFMSGYADHAAFGTGLLQAGEHFIQKPFASAALTARVRAILDGRPASPTL